MIKQTQTRTISFYTFGCRLNQAETAVIENSFKDPQYTIVDISQPADIVVINTCTVTENGDADTRHLVHKISRLNPSAQIALVGCQAQIQKEKLLDLPNIHWVVGNAKKFDLAQIVQAVDIKPQVITPAIPRESFSIALAGIDSRHTRANLKIQDGCDFFCSFCEIPYARGRARSRNFENILQEAEILTAAGHKEVVLTGINIGTYMFEGKTLLDVIDALEQISGLKRIRISSIEPTTVPKDLIQKMRGTSKLCRYLHIPLQSGSNKILNQMERKYTVEEFVEFIQFAHKTVPEICIGTDVIVGFPGETGEDFQQTFDVLRENPIDYVHVFSYSKRSLAKSRLLKNEISAPTKKQRSQILRDLSNRKRRVFQERMLQTAPEVLFEEKKKDTWLGVTDNYIRVKVRSERNLHNLLVKVQLQQIENQTVAGQLL